VLELLPRFPEDSIEYRRHRAKRDVWIRRVDQLDEATRRLIQSLEEFLVMPVALFTEVRGARLAAAGPFLSGQFMTWHVVEGDGLWWRAAGRRPVVGRNYPRRRKQRLPRRPLRGGNAGTARRLGSQQSCPAPPLDFSSSHQPSCTTTSSELDGPRHEQRPRAPTTLRRAGATDPVADYGARMRRFLTWLRGHWYGENQIAVSIRGQEAIGEEEWRTLPDDLRARWEPADVDGFEGFYVRRPA
jgi:hypothetical protein